MLAQLSDFLRWPNVEDDYRFLCYTKINKQEKNQCVALTSLTGGRGGRVNGTSQGEASRCRDSEQALSLTEVGLTPRARV